MTSVNVKKKASSSTKWALFSNLSPKVVSPLLLIILGRLLAPEDYGVVSIAKQGLYLPSGLALTEAQLEEVC